MKVHILIAKGPLRHLEGMGQLISRKAFRTRERAEEYVPTFKALAEEDRGGFNEIHDVKIQIQEIELEDE
jgi:hypothetical protein